MDSRIKLLRRSLDLTQQEFAERIGLKRNTIANYETGRNNPIDAVVALICREFSVSEKWLRAGTGEMFLSVTLDEKYKKAANSIASGTSDLDRIIRQTLVYYYEMDDNSKATLMSYIKQMTTLVPVKEPIHSEAPEQAHWDNDFVVKDVNGDAG